MTKQGRLRAPPPPPAWPMLASKLVHVVADLGSLQLRIQCRGVGKEGSGRSQVRSIAATKAHRGGHGGPGWPKARAWDQVAEMADLLADGVGLESAEGQTGGMRSDGKVETGDGSRLGVIAIPSAAPIADILASSQGASASAFLSRTR